MHARAEMDIKPSVERPYTDSYGLENITCNMQAKQYGLLKFCDTDMVHA